MKACTRLRKGRSWKSRNTFRLCFHAIACLHDDRGTSCKKKNSVINLEIVNYIINRRNRRASNHRSHLARIPLEKLFSGRGDLLVYQEHAATSSPREDPFASALDDPRLVSLQDSSRSVCMGRNRVDEGHTPTLRTAWKSLLSAQCTTLRRVLCAGSFGPQPSALPLYERISGVRLLAEE